MLLSRFGTIPVIWGHQKWISPFPQPELNFFLNGFMLRNICADSRVLSWAVGDVLNSVAREAQSSYHIWTALPVIFASLRWPSRSVQLSFARLVVSPHGFTVPILFPGRSITLHCSACLWKVNWSGLGLWEMLHLIVGDTCSHSVCAQRQWGRHFIKDRRQTTLDRANDKVGMLNVLL